MAVVQTKNDLGLWAEGCRRRKEKNLNIQTVFSLGDCGDRDTGHQDKECQRGTVLQTRLRSILGAFYQRGQVCWHTGVGEGVWYGVQETLASVPTAWMLLRYTDSAPPFKHCLVQLGAPLSSPLQLIFSLLFASQVGKAHWI